MTSYHGDRKATNRRSLIPEECSEVSYDRIGFAFPFVNRDDECRQLVQMLYDGLYIHLPKQQETFDHIKGALSFPYALGLSGIGKTRFGRVGLLKYADTYFAPMTCASANAHGHTNSDHKFREFMELIRDCLNIRVGLETILSYGGSVENFIARSILFEWLKCSLDSNQSVAQLQEACKSTYFGNLTVASVLDAVFELGKYSCVYINIDEADKGSEHLATIISIFGSYFATGKCLLFFVSGIKTSTLKAKLSVSTIKPQPINLPPLSIDHMRDIVRKVLPCYDVENRLFSHLLWLTGGIPKYLVSLLCCAGLDANQLPTDPFNSEVITQYLQLSTTSFISIMNRFKTKALSFDQYQRTGCTVFQYLVALSVSNIPVSPHTLVAENGFSIEKAEEEQLAYVGSDNRLQIPPVLLSHFYDNTTEPTRTLLRILASLNCTQTSRENEALLSAVIYYRILTASVFLKQNKVTLTYLLGDICSTERFQTAEVSIAEVLSKGVEVVQKAIKDAESIPKTPGIYINTATAPFADMIAVFPEMTLFVQEKSSIVANVKHMQRKLSSRISNNAVYKEIMKVSSSMSSKDLFLFITDDNDRVDVESRGLPDNCVCVCSEGHDKLLGPFIAQLRRHVLCRDATDSQMITAASTSSASIVTSSMDNVSKRVKY